MAPTTLRNPSPEEILSALGGSYEETHRYRPNGYLTITLEGPAGTVRLVDTGSGTEATLEERRICDRCGRSGAMTLHDDKGRRRDVCPSDCADKVASLFFGTGATRVWTE